MHWEERGDAATAPADPLLTHLSQRLRGELIGQQLNRRISIRVCRPFTLSNINISETSWRITIKFYLKHQFDEGKAA